MTLDRELEIPDVVSSSSDDESPPNSQLQSLEPDFVSDVCPPETFDIPQLDSQGIFDSCILQKNSAYAYHAVVRLERMTKYNVILNIMLYYDIIAKNLFRNSQKLNIELNSSS